MVVAVPPPCGTCAACRSGQADRCQQAFLVAIGRDPLAPPHGGFAPRLAVGANRVVKVHPDLSETQAAQVEPATVAFHAVRRTQPRLGDIAVVQGAGPIGLTTMQWVASAGAGQVIVVEPNKARRDIAARLGASDAVSPDEAGPLIAERTKGLGRRCGLRMRRSARDHPGARSTTPGGVGTVSLIGLPNGRAEIDPGIWLVKEIELQASVAYQHEDFEMAMAMIVDGHVDLDAMHTTTVGLDGLAGALDGLAAGGGRRSQGAGRPQPVIRGGDRSTRSDSAGGLAGR